MSLSELAGRGWLEAEPPDITSGMQVMAVVDGVDVKVGFERKDSPIVDTPNMIHRRFRSGRFDVDIRVETGDGVLATGGKVRVTEADGYDMQK